MTTAERVNLISSDVKNLKLNETPNSIDQVREIFIYRLSTQKFKIIFNWPQLVSNYAK